MLPKTIIFQVCSKYQQKTHHLHGKIRVCRFLLLLHFRAIDMIRCYPHIKAYHIYSIVVVVSFSVFQASIFARCNRNLFASRNFSETIISISLVRIGLVDLVVAIFRARFCCCYSELLKFIGCYNLSLIDDCLYFQRRIIQFDEKYENEKYPFFRTHSREYNCFCKFFLFFLGRT